MKLEKMGTLLLSCAMCACTSAVTSLPADERVNAFPFIRDGVTWKSDLGRRGFGGPQIEYENGRIHVYSVRKDKTGLWHIGQWEYPRHDEVFDLILVFGPDGLLERHGLVKARGNAEWSTSRLFP